MILGLRRSWDPANTIFLILAGVLQWFREIQVLCQNEGSRSNLKRSWGGLGRSWGGLGLSLGDLGWSLAALGRPWAALGSFQGATWWLLTCPRVSWGFLGPAQGAPKGCPGVGHEGDKLHASAQGARTLARLYVYIPLSRSPGIYVGCLGVSRSKRGTVLGCS